MDNFHGMMVPGFEHSPTIQATVISRQSGKVIVDVGSKPVGRAGMNSANPCQSLPARSILQ
jgi:D-serine deaminase-like pyridoxal phosphate-dependent protein